MRSCYGIGFLLLVLGAVASTDAAPPKAKPAPALPKVDADVLPSGQFGGIIVSAPNSDRMITLKITYPEVRLKPGAKMPNFRNAHAQNMNRLYQQMSRSNHHHAIHNMMQMQQMQMQQMQAMARIQQQQQQQELKLLQQEIRAIQNMYQVVQLTREFDFQLEENVKVRVKDLPEQFDEKGNIKKYTKEELAELKGKDKNLAGYESSVDALKPGQTILLALRVHKKPKPAAKLTTPVASKDKDAAEEKEGAKDKEKDAVKDKEAAKDKDVAKDKDMDSSLQHKMQVQIIVILKDGDAPPSSTPRTKKKK